MIGLRRHVVRVVEHRSDWASLADEACRLIRQTAGDCLLDVQHVGSTAVPGLPAKPILDLAGAVATLDAIPELIDRLTEAGYIYRGDAGDSGGHLFVWESSPDVRTIHLHLVEIGDAQWSDYLRFRDVLRQNPDIRKRYAELKRELTSKFPGDRRSYADGKHAFIQDILEKGTSEPDGTDRSSTDTS